MMLDVSEAARRLVARTCSAQGLPETVEDPAVLGAVARLLQATRDEERPAGRSTATFTTDPALAQGGGRRVHRT